MTIEYEELSTGSGTFQKWEKVGDTVEGRIHSFTVDGGRDFYGNPCPEVVVETTHGNVTVTASQKNLAKQLERHATRLGIGHAIKITWAGEYDTKHGTKGKDFTLAVSKTPVAPVVVELTDDEAPF
jgi:hypothetical protein